MSKDEDEKHHEREVSKSAPNTKETTFFSYTDLISPSLFKKN